jgi:hypothetical protein
LTQRGGPCPRTAPRILTAKSTCYREALPPHRSQNARREPRPSTPPRTKRSGGDPGIAGGRGGPVRGHPLAGSFVVHSSAYWYHIGIRVRAESGRLTFLLGREFLAATTERSVVNSAEGPLADRPVPTRYRGPEGFGGGAG